MKKNSVLHITNGDGLSEKVRELRMEGDLITWREMLSEGPAVSEIGEEEFIDLRVRFLSKNYKISRKRYQQEFLSELDRLAAINDYEEVILWFEFDLFSHMNLLGLISFMVQNRKTQPLYLVCSKRLKGEEELVPLSELSAKTLRDHFKHRIALNNDDIATAQLIWELYCSKNPKRLSSEINKTTNFEYLASSIRAHIERFPSVKTGLNTLETNVLKLINEHDIKNLHHLLGYALKYQGYYGYVDIQMERVIKKLELFYFKSKTGIQLTEDGLKALEGKKNFYQYLKDEEYYGGVRKYDFLYNPDNHDLLKL